MKKIICFTLCFISFLTQAQKVYKYADGSIVLLLTEEAGMPKGSFTSVSKTQWLENKNPSSSAFLSVASECTSAGTINKEVFQKLEIAPRDLSSKGDLSSPSSGMRWDVGLKGCRNLVYKGKSDWRLPTQRELMLIYMLHPIIESFYDGTDTYEKFKTDKGDIGAYWPLTEQSISKAWRFFFYEGSSFYSGKSTATHSVRCVRELTN